MSSAIPATENMQKAEPEDRPPYGQKKAKNTGISPRKTGSGQKKIRWIVGLAVGTVLVLVTVFSIANQFSAADQQLVFYTVERGNLPITVTERGTIESQENVQVLCKIDDIDGDGIRGTPILWIIENGASVKKGDLVVELESSGHQEKYDRQILDLEKARAEQIQAQVKYENQITQNETTEAEAELQVKLAKLELTMFKDPVSGTHKLEVEDINRLIDDINSEILTAKAQLELAKKDKRASESLFKLGYAGKSELERSQLELLQAESQYAAKMNRLRTQLAALKKKQTYEKDMQLFTLDGKLATAQRKLIQVKRDNQALEDQAKAAKDAADRSFQKEKERLDRYKEELENCKIYSPADGMVAYAVADSKRYWLEEIRPGAPVRNRQHLLSIPNLKKMQVKTYVHESVIDQIREGLPATVRIEAFPDKHYEAKVKSVGVLAVQQNPETKVYETIVTIDGEVEQLKPGMTAVVEIYIDRVENALSVPVQAVVQRNNHSWCYVRTGGSIERRKVQLGLTNHKFVEVREGLNEGDRVVLNPMAIVEKSDTEEEEEISSESESLSPSQPE